MIGILLAIQANQWNQGKIQDKLETKLLMEVQLGLLNDQKDVDSNLNGSAGHKAIYRDQNKSIQWLKSDTLHHPIDSLTIYFSNSFRATTFYVTSAPFDALKEFGLNNISNDSIKNEIQLLYDVYYPEYRKFIGRYYELMYKALEKGENYFEDHGQFINGMRPYDIEALKKDRPFLFALSRLRSFNQLIIHFNNRLQGRQRNILEMLDQELQSRNK
jgi:hypothetical protein